MTHSEHSNRRIRVLMIMPSFYPVVGGMEIQVERLIPYVREHGIDAAVLTRRPAGTAKAEQRDDVEIRRVMVSGGPGLRSIAFTLFSVVDIVRNRREIDVIHAHSIMSPTTIAAVAGLLLRKPSIVTLHNSYEPEHLLNKPFGKHRLRLYRRIISRFVSISSDIKQLLHQHGVPSSRIVSIPNGIDTTHFSPALNPERSSLRARLGLPLEQPIVVFVGRLQPVKQVDVLLHAWAGAESGHLIVLGDGEERDALTELAKTLKLGGRVEFRGMVPNVVDYLRAADIFVLPSASEGLSVALLEAMSSGLVPVATAIGGAVELIEDQETGLLVQSGDIIGLRSALSHALSSPAWRQSATQRGRELMVANYDLRVIAARLAGVYHDLTTDRPG